MKMTKTLILAFIFSCFSTQSIAEQVIPENHKQFCEIIANSSDDKIEALVNCLESRWSF